MKASIKTISFILLCSLVTTAKAQVSNSFDCDIINSLFKLKYVKEKLLLDKNKHEAIILIDTSHFFNSCSLPNMFDRQIIFVSDSVTERQKRTSNFLIYQMSYSKGIYNIGLFYKRSGASIRYKFRKKKGKYIFFKNESGFF